MINSSFLSIETPVKLSIRKQDEVTPVKCVNLNKRFKPTPDIQRQLTQFERIHNFQYHENVRFLPLKELGITNNLVSSLSAFFKQTIDIPDTVKKYEEAAIDSKYFNVFLRDYISEEFDCQIDYSFSIVSVLHYVHIYDVTLDDALCELFEFSTSQSLCQLCVRGDDPKERKDIADRHNFNLLNSLLVRKDGDISGSDDSLDDPTCDIGLEPSEEDTDSSSEIDANVSEKFPKADDKEFFFNPFLSDNNYAHSEYNEAEFIFNPFEVIDGESNVLNSTIAFNPFGGCEGGLGGLNDCSPVAHLKNQKVISCDHCGKTFKNRYNSKLHSIREISQMIESEKRKNKLGLSWAKLSTRLASKAS